MSIWQSVIAVISALAGTVLGNVLKSRADTAGRVHEWQVSIVEIFGDLMKALSSHYVAMWDLEAARIRGDRDEIDATLAASLVTRDAITRPHAQLEILAPQLRSQITHAVGALYAMDTALQETTRTQEQLTTRRLAAKAAMEELKTTMAAVMGRLGAGLPTRIRVT